MPAKKLPFMIAAILSLVLGLMFSPLEAGQVQLSWEAPTTNTDGTSLTDLAGYQVYYGQASGAYDFTIDVGNSTTYSLSGLEDGQTYYFAVTAYDTSGNESDFSNEATAIIPQDDVIRVSLSPQEDTFININSVNSSTETILATYTWPDNKKANAILMKFDLSDIPPGSTIVEAVLNLALIDSDATTDSTYTITGHKLINKNPVIDRATGYTYDGTNGWTPNTCCYDNIPLAQADISSKYDEKAVNKALGYKSWTLTLMVQEWLDDPSTNFGLLLNSDPSKLRDRYRFFASMEHPDPSLRPYLTITYSHVKHLPIEVGEVNVDHNWKRVSLAKAFRDPVVVAKPPSYNAVDPAVVRIRNVDSTGFDIRLQEWDYLDGTHAIEIVAYVVMERGKYTLEDGTLLEAERFSTNKTKSFGSFTFKQTFNAVPVMLTAISSFNEADAVTGRLKDISTTGFKFRMQEQELNEQTHASETISYIAWEPSAGTVNGLTFEVNKTPNAIRHWFQTILFTQAFAGMPKFIADMQTTNGGDTASLRWDNKDLSGVDVKVEEEQSRDNEIDHTNEVVGYLIIR